MELSVKMPNWRGFSFLGGDRIACLWNVSSILERLNPNGSLNRNGNRALVHDKSRRRCDKLECKEDRLSASGNETVFFRFQGRGFVF
ncbi:hypothetical protein GC56T2_2910 [Geobacillus sp. C56-T2]|nr:hypothetical protein GC56T2_2910 [Geobacillus sp. C56-T2]